MNVNNVPVNMNVDSCANCRIINSDIHRKCVNNGAKSVEKKTRMYPYSSPAIISHHYIQGTISYKGIDVSATLIVIDGEIIFLMEKDATEELGVLRIEINDMNTESIMNQYPMSLRRNLETTENERRYSH